MRWRKSADGEGGKEGMFEWVVDVEAGGEVTIEIQWDVYTYCWRWLIDSSRTWGKRIRGVLSCTNIMRYYYNMEP